MRQHIDQNTYRVWVLDSIAELRPEDRGQIIVCGSHGGHSAAEYALAHPPRIVVFNDAGVGKQAAGIAALSRLEAAGIIAATVGHDTARIGDGLDSWRSGRLSHLNALARQAGFRLGDPVAAALERCARRPAWRLCRLDDNGNRFVKARRLTQAQADSERARFEALGHKQSYWIEIDDAPAPNQSEQ